jgi:O-antigen ligase
LAKRRRKGRGTRPAPKAGRHAPEAISLPVRRITVSEAIAIAALVVVLAGTALLVDPGAHASFDAPKRLVAAAGTAVAAFGAFAFARRSRSLPVPWRRVQPAARIALIAVMIALVWSLLSAVLSPRRAPSLDSLRAMLLYVLLVPLGASAAVGRGKSALAATFLAATTANAAISLLQSRGVQPFRLETFGTRNLTGALAGNVGYLTITVALAVVLALGIAISTRRRSIRAAALAALVLLLATLVVNRNLTALVSVAIGTMALLIGMFGRRSLAPISAVAVALLVAVIAAAPVRHRAAATIAAGRAGDWDRLTTYRTGAWAAALEMTRERPIAGWGPGTYAAEFVPHRLRAEIRARRRFVNPLVTSSYSEAHCDYLQAFAEGGIPGGMAAVVAAGALVVGVGRRTRSGASRAEAAILLGLLVAGAAAALTWFPLQRPITAAPLLLAAGRGWRLAAGWPDESPS